MERELKPCPFCGSDDLELMSSYYTVDIKNKWDASISCKKCTAKFKSGDRVYTEKKAIESVVNAWNKRFDGVK